MRKESLGLPKYVFWGGVEGRAMKAKRIQFVPAYFPQLLHHSAKLLCSEPWGRHEASLCRFGPGPEKVKEEFVLPLAKRTAYTVAPTAAQFPYP